MMDKSAYCRDRAKHLEENEGMIGVKAYEKAELEWDAYAKEQLSEPSIRSIISEEDFIYE